MPGLYARQGPDFIANSTTFDDQRLPTVVKLASGNFVVIWDDLSRQGGDTDLGSVRAQIFDPNGNPVGGELLVNSTTLRGQMDSNVAALSGGGFVVSWTDYNVEGTDNSSSSVKAQMFDSTGARIGGETLVNSTLPGYQMSSAVSGLPGGGYVAVWVDIQGLLSLQGNIRGQRFDGSGAKVGGEFTVNTLADNRQSSPTVTTLADGRFVVTWTDGTPGTLDGSGHSVRGQMFNADGSRIGSEFQVNQSAYGNQQSQSVTALAGGGFLAVWADQQGFPGSELFEAGGSALEAQIFDSDGNRVGDEFLLNPVRRTGSSGATVAAMADGTFVVSWNDFAYRDNDEIWSHVAAQAFDARGNRLGDQFYLETHRSVHDQTALAALDGGRFVAVWHGGAGSGYHNNYPGDIRAQIFAPARGVLDIQLSNAALSETQPNNLQIGTITPISEAVNARVTYQIVADSSGGAFRIEGNRIVVADNSRLDYESGSTVTLTVRAFDGAGGHYDEVVRLTLVDAAIERRWAATEEVQVNTTISWDQEDPAVAAVAGGGHVVVWEDPDSGGDRFGPSIKAQMYDSAGARVGREFRVNGPMGGQQFDPDAATLANGGFVVSWTELDPGSADGTSVKAMIFDSSGRPIAGEFGEFFLQADPAQSGNQGDSAVAGLWYGGFAASWYDPAGDGSGGGIKARVFTTAGAAAGPEIVVNTNAGGEQDQPAIASLASGGFVVTWTDSSGSPDSAGRGDHSGTGIKGQLFDSAGDRVGGEFLANGATDGNQSGSAVTGLAGGGFVVAWHHLMFGGSITRAQVFDAYGRRVGGEILVDEYGMDPAVTALADGGFIIAIQGDGGEGRDRVAITAQQFDSAGNRVGGEWVVNEAVPGNQRAPALVTLSSGDVTIAWMEPADSPASDRNGGSIRARTFVAPTEVPEAAKDGFTTGEATRLSGNVFLDNGFGPDTGRAEVAAVNGSAAAVGQQIRLASGALLALNADGSFTYDSNGAFAPLVDPASGAANGAASDRFTYTLVGGSSADVTVRVTGVTAPGEPFLGSAGNDRLTGTGDANLFRLDQGGDDYAAGGAGDDVFWFGAKMNWLDQVGGGEGDDRVVLQGNYQTHFGTGSFFEVERLVLLSSEDSSFGGGNPQSLYGYTLSLLDGAVHSGHSLTIDAQGLRSGEILGLSAGNVRGALIVKGGAGNDRIATGTGNDLVYGGAGDDTLDGGAGDDLLDGGAGADRIDGGAGHDRVSYASSAAAVYVTLALPGAQQNTIGAGIDTLIGVEGLIGTVFSDTLIGDGSDNFLDGNAGADILRGSGGDDSYVVDDAGDTVEELAGEGTDTIFTALAAYSLLGSNVENLSATTNIAHDFRGNAGDNVVRGGGGADVFRLQDGGADGAFGGDGEDFFYFGGALTAADTVDGGTGKDELAIQGNYTGANRLLMSGVTNVEALVLLPGSDARFGDSSNASYSYDIATANSTVAAGGRLVVDAGRLRSGENFTFDGSAELDGWFFLFAGKGIDTLTGGAQSDAFLFRGPGNFTAADRVNGGGGLDELVLRGDYTGEYAVTFGTATIAGIEAIVVVSGKDLRYGKLASNYGYDLKVHDGNLAAGQTMIVDAGTLREVESLKFDGSSELGGHFRMFGGRGNDILIGGAGNDSIRGGFGADTLKGNGGNDTFVYRAAGESTSTAHDVIDGFQFGSDLLDLPGTHDHYGHISGTLNSASFDSDMAAAMEGLFPSHALFLSVTGGDLANRLFLVVDQNGVGGYQAGEDFVIEFVNTAVPAPPIPDFIV